MATKKATSSKGPLLGEVSHPDTMSQRGRFADELAVSNDEVLRTHGGNDLALYARLLTDGQVASVSEQRFLATISRPWVVEAGGPSPLDAAAADHLREQIKNVGFDRASKHLLLAVLLGFSLAECIYKLEGSLIVLSQLKTRKPRRFGFSKSGKLMMIRPETRVMPPRKFWVWRFGGDDDDLHGRGKGEALYWPVWFKRNALRFWSTWLERYASPTPVAKGPAGMSPIDEQKLLELLGHVTNGGRVVIPKHVEIAFLESARQSGGDYEVFVNYWDDQITKILMSQTMTTEDGASLSQAQVHQDVGQTVTTSDADMLCESFVRGPATWLTEWNFPGAKVPLVYRDMSDAEDLSALAERDTKLNAMGYRPTAERVEEVYGDGYEAAPAQQTGAPFSSPLLDTLPTISTPAEPAQAATSDAFNGAQTATLVEVLEKYFAKTLPRSAAKNVILVAFPTVTPERADAMLDDVPVISPIVDTLPQAQAPANFAEPKAPPDIEPTAEDLGGDWQQAMGAEVDEIEELLKSANSLEEVRDRLGELVKREPKALTDSITRRRFAARVAGEAEQ